MLPGAVMLGLLWRGRGSMRVPVIVYLMVILAMLWQAVTRRVMLGTPGAWLAAVGVAVFVVLRLGAGRWTGFGSRIARRRL